MGQTKTKNNTINVVNKQSRRIAKTTPERAAFAVKRKKARWVDSSTIQVLYFHKDIKRMRREVLERDSYLCYYCGIQMKEEHPLLTVDHVVPLRLGGSVLPENMVCSCKKCNEQKGHRTYENYFTNLYALLLQLCLSYNLIRKGDRNEAQKKGQTLP